MKRSTLVQCLVDGFGFAAPLALSGLGCLIIAPAQAQNTQPPASSPRNQLEEVIVTAQKRSENVQNVPIAMQAYTADQLQKARVSELTDITRMAPNLNVVVQNALSQHIVIRGVGTNEFFGNAPSSVGMYMDEVTMNCSTWSASKCCAVRKTACSGAIPPAAPSTTSLACRASARKAKATRC
jgi:outer membrane receptor protein involved in Fe transport